MWPAVRPLPRCAMSTRLAQHLSIRASCPSCAIPRHSPEEVCMMVTLKRILVATDFDEAADVALEYGRELARTFRSSLDVLHVVDNVVARGLAGEGFMGAYPDLQRGVEQAAEKRLAERISEEDRILLDAAPVLRTSSSPALAIVEYAQAAGVDLIVMGTHGRGAMAQLLMGSVAERVVRLAPCPVLTLKHPEHEFIQPDALAAVNKA